MKIRNLFLFVMVALLTFSFVACGETPSDSTDTGSVISDDSTDTEALTTEAAVSVFFGKHNALKCSIVVNDGDTVGKNIADYIAGQVKDITGAEMSIVNSTDNLEAMIVIGENIIPDLEHKADEFVIKFVEKNLYISYAAGASAFQAVSAVLDDALFASYNSDGNTYTLASDFEFSGKCGDYIIGDNEFNPFE